jgi:hypothetical protein
MGGTSLQKAVEEVTGPLKKSGCRVVADVKEVYVYDMPRWTHETTELLQYLRPRARVHVYTSTQSLSGFLIHIMEEPEPPYVWARALCACAMLLLMGFVWWRSGLSAPEEAEL